MKGLKRAVAWASRTLSGIVKPRYRDVVVAGLPIALLASLILYPAIWSLAIPWLEKVIPQPVFEAIHEFRHLLGIPCH